MGQYTSLQDQSKTDFDDAYFRGFIRSIEKWLGQNNKRLIAFNDILSHLSIRGQYDAGIQVIEMDKIIGSVNRYADFDDAFLPRQKHTRSRWEKIDRAYLRDEILPPVDVYQIGDFYFVIDGNHRVSVAKRRGQRWIDAHVVKIDVPYEIDRSFDFNKLILKKEQVQFYETTNLKKLYPDADIEMSIPGLFDRLREHIDAHRFYTSEYLQHEISYEKAVSSWYENIYIPLVKIIRERKILGQFPDRTEADLYFWIIEHLAYLKAEQHQDISFEEATHDFVVKFHPTFFKMVWFKIKKAFSKKD
ncbi:MAG: ParB N-terminal domain-containing protein [Chloroflexi bacterium]|nr:ParB N-terminal domain-containing protein [Chloroflexota bacterium]